MCAICAASAIKYGFTVSVGSTYLQHCLGVRDGGEKPGIFVSSCSKLPRCLTVQGPVRAGSHKYFIVPYSNAHVLYSTGTCAVLQGKARQGKQARQDSRACRKSLFFTVLRCTVYIQAYCMYCTDTVPVPVQVQDRFRCYMYCGVMVGLPEL